MKGSYVLIIKNKEDQNIKIGSLGNIFFKEGFYAYIGSALSSLEARIKRHLRDDKNLHWHIDYLLKKTEIIEVFCKKSTTKEECDIANFFNQKLELIPGFGCSDCKCKSHLFYGECETLLEYSKSSNLVPCIHMVPTGKKYKIFCMIMFLWLKKEI